jgi:hypothetical protein
LLAPLQLLPNFEVQGGWLRVMNDTVGKVLQGGGSWCEMELNLYVVPRGERRVVIPFHKCDVTFGHVGGEQMPVATMSLRTADLSGDGFGAGWGYGAEPIANQSLTVHATQSEAIIEGPGRVRLVARALGACAPKGSPEEVVVTAHLLPVDAERPVTVSVTLTRSRIDGLMRDDLCSASWRVKTDTTVT